MLNRAALEQRPEDDLLALVVSRARAMVGATLVAAWAPSDGGDGLVVAYAEGDGASALLETRAADTSVIVTAARQIRTEIVPDLGSDASHPNRN